MVVEENQRRRGRRRGGAKHLARMDNTGVERPDRQSRDTQNAMLGVEQKDAELLHRQRSELRNEEPRRVHGGQNLRPGLATPGQAAPADLDGGHQLRGSRHPDPGDAPQIIGRGTRQSIEPADRGECGVREFERAGPRIAVSQHDRQQLVVSETGHPQPFQLLPWTVVRRDGFHISYLLPASCFPRPAPRAPVFGG